MSDDPLTSTARIDRRRLLAGAALGGATLAGGALAGSASAATRTRTRKLKSNERYVLVGFITTISYWNGPKAGLAAVARDLGVKTDFVGPSDFDVQKQIDTLNQLVQQRPSGIIVLPAIAGALDDAITKALEQKIPVVTVEQGPPTPGSLGYLGFDRAEAGAVGARLLAKLIGGKGGKVAALIYNAGVADMQTGLKGFKDELKKLRPDLSVVVGIDKADPEYGTTVCSQLLQAHPDIKAFMSIDTSGGPSAARAVKAAGKKMPVIAGGLNEHNTEVWPLIENGQITAGICASAAMENYLGVQYMHDLNNNVIGGIDWHKYPSYRFIPRNTIMSIYVIDKSNVAAVRKLK